MREETGLELSGPRLFHVYLSRREGKEDHVALFVGECATAEPRPDGREVAEAAFFDPEGLPPDTSPAARRRIAEYRAGRPATDGW